MRKIPRPAVFLALHLAAGIAIAREPAWRPVAVAALALHHGWNPGRRAALGLAIAAGGALLALGDVPGRELAADPLVGEPIHRFEGTVAEPIDTRPGRDGRPPTAAFDLEVATIEGAGGRVHPRDGRVRVAVRDLEIAPRPGTRLRFLARVEPIRTAGNPGEYDPAAVAERRGIERIAVVPDPGLIEEVDGPGARPGAAIHRVRRRLSARIAADLPVREGGLLSRMILGPWDRIDPDLRDAFRAAGVAHLLAVSGLHVSVLVGLLWLGARASGVPRAVAGPILVAPIVAYAVLVGLRAPVLRASALAIAAIAAERLGRRTDGLQLLGLVALAHLVCDPGALGDPGFQLSYAAAAGILRLTGPIRRSLGLTDEPDPLLAFEAPWRRALAGTRRRLGEAFAVSTAAWLATAPVVAHHFGSISPVGLVANLVAIPLFVVAFWIGLAYATAAGLGLDGASSLLAWPAANATRVLCVTVEWFATWPGGSIAVGAPGPWLTAALLVAVFLRRPAIAAGLLAAGLVLSVVPPREGAKELEVVFLDVGHGGAALVFLPGGETALYDAGSADREALERRVLAPYLARRGRSRIDTVFVSHADLDHRSALEPVVRRFGVRRIVTTPRVLERLPWIRDLGPEVVRVECGDAVRLGPARAAVLAPAAGASGSDNDRSLALAIEWEGRRVLLTGDLEQAGLAALVLAGPGRVDVLQLPHHGEAAPGLEALLVATRPRLAVASARRGWSDLETRAACRAAGATFLETGTDGAVRVRLARRGVLVETARDAPWTAACENETRAGR